MQRIDENTYIDDTLVTCAEYQLFIDEMREQGFYGKYYQPDHWTTYHFPDGQAREPILGIRHSDAVAFCEWLTQREKGDWQYRLPIKEETIIYQVLTQNVEGLGYWSYNSSLEERVFIWASATIPNVIEQDFLKNILKIDIEHYRSRLRGYAVTFDSIPLKMGDLNYDRALTIAQQYEINRAIDLDFAQVINSDDFIDRLGRSFDNPNHVKIPTFDLYRPDVLARALVFNRVRDHNHIGFLSFAFYIDLLILEQRIAGRSPAFEGIRLVKERIK
jgi:hypothetical protein